MELLYKLAPDKVPIAYSPLGKDATGYKEMCVIIIDSVQTFMRRDENEIKFVPAFFQQITGRPVRCYEQQFTIMQLYMDLQYVLPETERTTLRSNFTMFTVRGGGCASPNVLALKDSAAKVAKNITSNMIESRYPVDLVKRGEYMETLTMCPNPN